MKIAVAGLGYVGLANAVMLSKHYDVYAFDIDKDKVLKTNEEYGKFRINATTDGKSACRDADFVIVATSTDFDADKNSFDTSSVEEVVSIAAETNPNIFAVIKSTVPIGYTKRLIKKTGFDRIIFSPEFLREGTAVYDCLNPSRIIIGREDRGDAFAEKYREAVMNCVEKTDVPLIFTGTAEAEAVKLFSNTYLAMRVAFFNELDTFAEKMDINARAVVEGVSLDPRIGSFYNNPSFGFGGYCLPKDTKQLLSEFGTIPQSIFSAVVESNEKRMDFIAKQICSRNPGTVGVYRLSMKAGSDNFRSSAVIGIINRLNEKGIRTVIYEPMIKQSRFGRSEVIEALDEFKSTSDVIIANRICDELNDVIDKTYTRDLFVKD